MRKGSKNVLHLLQFRLLANLTFMKIPMLRGKVGYDAKFTLFSNRYLLCGEDKKSLIGSVFYTNSCRLRGGNMKL